MKKYILKSKQVEVLQYDGSNIEEVKEILSDYQLLLSENRNSQTDNKDIEIIKDDIHQTIHEGDFIVKNEFNECVIFETEQFFETYTPAIGFPKMYIKMPVVREAICVKDSTEDELIYFCGYKINVCDKTIITLDGIVNYTEDDYIVRVDNNEYYALESKKFLELYEPSTFSAEITPEVHRLLFKKDRSQMGVNILKLCLKGMSKTQRTNYINILKNLDNLIENNPEILKPFEKDGIKKIISIIEEENK